MENASTLGSKPFWNFHILSHPSPTWYVSKRHTKEALFRNSHCCLWQAKGQMTNCLKILPSPVWHYKFSSFEKVTGAQKFALALALLKNPIRKHRDVSHVHCIWFLYGFQNWIILLNEYCMTDSYVYVILRDQHSRICFCYWK